MLLGRCSVPLENMMADSVSAQGHRAEMTEAMRRTCLRARLRLSNAPKRLGGIGANTKKPPVWHTSAFHLTVMGTSANILRVGMVVPITMFSCTCTLSLGPRRATV